MRTLGVWSQASPAKGRGIPSLKHRVEQSQELGTIVVRSSSWAPLAGLCPLPIADPPGKLSADGLEYKIWILWQHINRTPATQQTGLPNEPSSNLHAVADPLGILADADGLNDSSHLRKGRSFRLKLESGVGHATAHHCGQRTDRGGLRPGKRLLGPGCLQPPTRLNGLLSKDLMVARQLCRNTTRLDLGLTAPYFEAGNIGRWDLRGHGGVSKRDCGPILPLP